MGGCASSKYVVGEDKEAKDKKPIKKSKDKKDKKGKKNVNETANASNNNNHNSNGVNGTVGDGAATATKANLEDELEFIDKEELDKQHQQQQQQQADDSLKKEVTTYQTTVVKHIEKEGDELLVHLKEEAFQTLKNLLKQNSKVNQTNIKSTIDGDKVSTSTFAGSNNNEEELLHEIKTQVLNAVKNANKNDGTETTDENQINYIIDTSVDLIKENEVNTMSELEAKLNDKFTNDANLIKKVINSTTGFLTAKGTEAGTMLSSILANLTNSSIQGELKETEKTTVKVTRTITEKIVNAKGETKIIVKKITDTVTNPPANATPEELMKKLASQTNSNDRQEEIVAIIDDTSSALTPLATPTVLDQNSSALTGLLVASKLKLELENDDAETVEQAKQIVNNVVNAAKLKLSQEMLEAADSPATEEEASNPKKSNSRDNIASEFYKSGKDAAEKLIKTVDSNNQISSISSSSNETPNK